MCAGLDEAHIHVCRLVSTAPGVKAPNREAMCVAIGQ